MARKDHALIVDDDRNREPELLNASCEQAQLSFWVCTRIATVRSKAAGRNLLYFVRRHNGSISDKGAM
jgi:hypothetical protein